MPSPYLPGITTGALPRPPVSRPPAMGALPGGANPMAYGYGPQARFFPDNRGAPMPMAAPAPMPGPAPAPIGALPVAGPPAVQQKNGVPMDRQGGAHGGGNRGRDPGGTGGGRA